MYIVTKNFLNDYVISLYCAGLLKSIVSGRWWSLVSWK